MQLKSVTATEERLKALILCRLEACRLHRRQHGKTQLLESITMGCSVNVSFSPGMKILDSESKANATTHNIQSIINLLSVLVLKTLQCDQAPSGLGGLLMEQVGSCNADNRQWGHPTMCQGVGDCSYHLMLSHLFARLETKGSTEPFTSS